MKLVIIESPYAGDIETNTRYARAALRDSLGRGEAPLASHLLYTQPGVLDDGDAGERRLGMKAGHCWIRQAGIVAVYQDLGVSKGMVDGMMIAERLNVRILFRTIDGWQEKETKP